MESFQEYVGEPNTYRNLIDFNDYILDLCESILNLLKDYLEIPEIKENEKRIAIRIKEIVLELFRIKKNASPKLILAAAIYFCNFFKLRVIMAIFKISQNSLLNFLELIKIFCSNRRG